MCIHSMKKDISTVTFKNKLATCIIYSNIELTKTKVLTQNTTLLVRSSLHFSLCKLLVYLNYAQTFVCGKKSGKLSRTSKQFKRLYE